MEKLKRKEVKALIALNDINEENFIKKYINKNVKVLLEQEVKGKENIF